jgi:hypothetical protein
VKIERKFAPKFQVAPKYPAHLQEQDLAAERTRIAHLQQQNNSQLHMQNMLAMGQAQYVMIPGVGLTLVPIMQAPNMTQGQGMGMHTSHHMV